MRTKEPGETTNPPTPPTKDPWDWIAGTGGGGGYGPGEPLRPPPYTNKYPNPNPPPNTPATGTGYWNTGGGGGGETGYGLAPLPGSAGYGGSPYPPQYYGGGGGGGGGDPWGGIPAAYRTGFESVFGTDYYKAGDLTSNPRTDYQNMVNQIGGHIGRSFTDTEWTPYFAGLKGWAGTLGRSPQTSDMMRYTGQVYGKAPATPPVSFLRTGEM